MLTNAETVKYELDVVDKMLDTIQRKIRSNENLMGALNSAYEYDTATGYAVNETEIAELRKNVAMNANLIKYRSELMNYATGISSSAPTLTVEDGFSF